jgi:hypothetical protein
MGHASMGIFSCFCRADGDLYGHDISAHLLHVFLATYLVYTLLRNYYHDTLPFRANTCGESRSQEYTCGDSACSSVGDLYLYPSPLHFCDSIDTTKNNCGKPERQETTA